MRSIGLFRTLLVAAFPVCLAIPAAAQDSSTLTTQVLRPGDVVNVQIWREETLSGEFPVAEDGTVVLPRIGRWDVMSQPPDELRRSMLAEYAKYLRNPSIEITFLRRITILGAVREPGLKLLDPTMSMAEAIGMAGGTTMEGATNRIVLMRDGRALLTVTNAVNIAETPLRSGDQLYIPERSWISRNQGVVAAVISGLVSISIALIAR